MKPMLLQARSLGRTYRQGGSVVEALCDVNLDVAPGEFLVVTGPSGCGKTTLLHILGLLDWQFSGEVRLDGRSIQPLTVAQRARTRLERVGFVFQESCLLPALSALDNTALPHWRLTGSAQKARRRARELLVRLGLEHRLRHKPARLSGGEAQRVALARALSNHPDLLLADEPTAHLDDAASSQVIELLERASRKNVAVIVASHDPAVARRAARALPLSYGRTVQEPFAGERALLSCRRSYA